MRRILILLGVVGALMAGTVGNAAAHTLEQDNGVSAVLHIAPDDNPRAGEKTYMNFSFSSQNPKFDVRYCGCTVSLQASENRLLGAKIEGAGDSATVGSAQLEFPKAGVYDLTVQGFTDDRLQQRFNLDFRVRVAAAAADQGNPLVSPKSLQVIMLGLTSLVLLGMLAAQMIARGERYRVH